MLPSFRRTEQRDLASHQSEHAHQITQRVQVECPDGEHHENDFSDIAGQDDVSFVEAIRQKAGQRCQQHIGEYEADRSHHQDPAETSRFDQLLANSNHQPAERIVVNCPQKLGPEEPLKAGR